MEATEHWAHEIQDFKISESSIYFVAVDGSELRIERQECQARYLAALETPRSDGGFDAYCDVTAIPPYIEFLTEPPTRILFKHSGPLLQRPGTFEQGMAASYFYTLWHALLSEGWYPFDAS